MSNTPHLKLPYLFPAQAQKHVTVNEGLAQLDTLVHCAVTELFRNDPPETPAAGDRYLLGTSPTGAWAGQASRLAAFVNGGWVFVAPERGWRVYNLADDTLYALNAALVWVPVGGASGGGSPAIQDAALFGLATTADAANPFAARLNTALWTARAAGDGGSGDLRIVVNKEAPAATASLLFQTAFSGRAEFGLTGTDNFTVKVSGDGSTWKEAIEVDKSTGKVGFPAGMKDIEYGTWTPGFTFTAPGDTVVTYLRQTGSFIRIGSIVLYEFDLRVNATYSTASGQARVTGLPFPADNNFTAFGNLGIGGGTVWPADRTTLFVFRQNTPGTDRLQMRGDGPGGTTIFGTAHVPSGEDCFFFGVGRYTLES